METQQSVLKLDTARPIAHRKRQKVSVACEPCRRKKMKCDAARPTCSACKKSSERVECLYSTDRTSNKEKSASVTSSLSGFPSLTADKPVLTTTDHGLPSRIIDPQSHAIISETLPYGKVTSGAPAPATAMTPANRVHEQFSVDSMNGVTGDPAQTHEIFGNSSAGSFMRQIQAAMNAKQRVSLFPAWGSQKEVPNKRSLGPSLSSHEEATLLVLPPRDLADRLIQAYWEFEWSLFPVVNKHEVDTFYQSLWSCSRPGFSVISMSIVNMCFALGCHYCSFLPPEERGPMGSSFFARADQLYKKSGNTPTLERVHLLLLIGIYLQSTDNPFQCWMTVGEAIRIAQSLGICFPQDSSSETVSQKEMKRRTWHSCIWLDRVLSATLGRPGMIPKWLFSSVSLPSMIDDEFFDTQEGGSDVRPDGRPCVMAFSIKAFELYQILDDVLVDIYLAQTREQDFEHKITNIIQIDRKIQAWKKTVPKHLQYPPTATYDAMATRQATILRIRFLHVRILLLRPALVGYCKRGASLKNSENHDSADSSLSDLMLVECSRLCFRLAHELIHIFNDKLVAKDMTGPLPSWWYSVLYVYTAATTIVVERFLGVKDDISEKSEARHAWDEAINILRSYTVVADSAGKCLAALEALTENLLLDGESHPVATNGPIYSPEPNILWEMSRILGEQSSVLPFGFDDFLWLG